MFLRKRKVRVAIRETESFPLESVFDQKRRSMEHRRKVEVWGCRRRQSPEAPSGFNNTKHNCNNRRTQS